MARLEVKRKKKTRMKRKEGEGGEADKKGKEKEKKRERKKEKQKQKQKQNKNKNQKQQNKKPQKTNLGLENDVGITLVELALVAVLIRGFLDDLQLLHTPDLKTRLLTDTLVAGVENGGQTLGRLES